MINRNVLLLKLYKIATPELVQEWTGTNYVYNCETFATVFALGWITIRKKELMCQICVADSWPTKAYLIY